MSVPADRMFLDPVKSSVDVSLASMKPMQGIAPVGGVQPTAARGVAPTLAGGNVGFDPASAGFDIGTQVGDTGGMGGVDGFDWGGAMKGFADFGSGITSLAGLYNSYKQLGMMEDQLNFARADRNQNVANQAAITNDRLRSQREAEAQLKGHKPGTAGYDAFVAGGTKVDGSAV